MTFLGILISCMSDVAFYYLRLDRYGLAWEDSHRGSCLQDVSIGRLATACSLAPNECDTESAPSW